MEINKIFFVLVDSVRNYRSDDGKGDERDRLRMMDEFAKESFEFQTVVTNAPSTVMSVSAIMSSTPSNLLARTYEGFEFNSEQFSPITTELQRNGFKINSLIFHKEVREKLVGMMPHISLKHLPPGTRHGTKSLTNEQVYEAFFNRFLESDDYDSSAKSFNYIHFNCRGDWATNETITKTIRKIKEIDDNSLIILCSDHGYPDPTRGFTPEKFKEANLTHDVVMTNDNLMIPLFFRLPKGKVIGRSEKLVSSLDIGPTILSIVGIKPKRTDYYGCSLYRNGKFDAPEDRLLRVDSRYLYQHGRQSAIMSEEFKLLYSHDSGTWEMFNWSRGLLEESRISEINDVKQADFRDSALQLMWDLEAEALYKIIEGKVDRGGVYNVKSAIPINNQVQSALNNKLICNGSCLDAEIGKAIAIDSSTYKNLKKSGVDVIAAYPRKIFPLALARRFMNNWQFYKTDYLSLVEDISFYIRRVKRFLA